MTVIALGLALGMVMSVGLVLALQALAGEDPPAEAADTWRDAELSPDALFHPMMWVRGREPHAGAAAAAYNRPLEVELAPDQDILPPPRGVRGVNNEV
jgi:hypothetical protein